MFSKEQSYLGACFSRPEKGNNRCDLINKMTSGNQVEIEEQK